MATQRYFLWIAYNGNEYHGWQIQPNAKSIQATIEDALTILFKKPIEIVGAGRTDTGVHALEMVAHVDLPLLDNIDLIKKQLNGILPQSIAIDQIRPVRPDAHARFDASSRTYEYWIITKKNPFYLHAATAVYAPLDFEAMNRAASMLLKYTDFTSFSKLHTDVKTNDCIIQEAFWKQRGDLWVFTITANRFLRNMVRAIVGTLLQIGRGNIDEENFRDIIEAKNRNKAGASVNPDGLYLIHVTYPQELFALN
ncbi:tRNA pseudouridine(38-40) synthase TruA [Microbacter margulisiae]|uniref:tRNA pseudouridine synthase A n=1 Tax=Microbacter margulisiae TaxID=1350067 RepID=A0A7W5H1N2_9PORP|nr:tRNA pseudouridine(38-40) synthase TruA [Microbacter margulisiae]MBB3187773.1 tRNA pseudouridine38-40 synthase [Microbacter margulisiae]